MRAANASSWCRILLAALACAGATPACSSNRLDKFYSQVYACDSRLPVPDCGTDRAGAAMICSKVTETLGGSDICAQMCAEGPEASTDTYACLQDGSKATRCRPSDGTKACADPELSCLRTDLEHDEGLCLPLNTCSDDGQCTAQRTACMTSLARLQYPKAATSLQLDALHCMTVGCSATQTSCDKGEQCVQKVIDAENNPQDVCLPTCDQHRCPPNYTCLQRVSRAYPNLCIPGLLGRPCNTDLDCLIGQCTSLDYGYKACTRHCSTDEDCMPFDTAQTYFFCTSGRCVSPESLTWPDCIDDDDCVALDPRLVCARTDPQNPTGACRIPCADDGSCPARAGIVHGCIAWSGVPVCHPGLFGRYPCSGDQDCAPGLHCLPSVAPFVGPMMCTIACVDDEDCVNDRQTTTGFCTNGICAPPQGDGYPCDRDRQCNSRACNLEAGQCMGDG